VIQDFDNTGLGLADIFKKLSFQIKENIQRRKGGWRGPSCDLHVDECIQIHNDN
jgi:hypothetical protein